MIILPKRHDEARPAVIIPTAPTPRKPKYMTRDQFERWFRMRRLVEQLEDEHAGSRPSTPIRNFIYRSIREYA